MASKKPASRTRSSKEQSGGNELDSVLNSAAFQALLKRTSENKSAREAVRKNPRKWLRENKIVLPRGVRIFAETRRSPAARENIFCVCWWQKINGLLKYVCYCYFPVKEPIISHPD